MEGLVRIGIRLTGAMSRLPLEESASWAAANGFADIETGLHDGLVETLRVHGLTAWAAAPRVQLLTADDAERERAIAEAKTAIDSAARQGVRVLCFGHRMVEGRSGADQIELFKAGFGPVARHAEQQGVKIAFEHWHNQGRNLLIAPDRWDACFNAVPSPNIGLNFDPSHLVVLHIDWLWALRQYRDRVFYVHAKDTELFPERRNRYGIYGPLVERETWWRYRLPGYGVVDWRKYVDVLYEIGYEGPINIEHEDRVWGFTEDVDKMRRGLLLARRFLESVI